ncbi:hypothetical protein JCM24511_02122 [Saitozyma sp. JCM 24511]|nr:hypothetical protein JCM24511_02122 [Saitozyma sp. JCM 24511]
MSAADEVAEVPGDKLQAIADLNPDARPDPLADADLCFPEPRHWASRLLPKNLLVNHEGLSGAYRFACVIFLLFSYFLSQYDKFVISYFQAELVADLSISSAGYGLLTGYGTSVLSSFAVCVGLFQRRRFSKLTTRRIPVAIFTDHSESRVWALTATIIWWSLMIIFQSLAKSFWQMICARLGMLFGQAASEALTPVQIAVSLISDLVQERHVPLAESMLYVGVYIGEAISARISSVFRSDGKTWRLAFKAIGITGLVIAVLSRLIVLEPRNRRRLILGHNASEVWQSLRYMMGLRSFWLITISTSLRQLAGNLQYPEDVSYLVATYGTIVALHITAWGGLISWPFVVVVTFSRKLAGGSASVGLRILFANLACAYITAELWLGAMASLIVSLLPIRYKTLGYAVYGLTNLLVYSSGPEIVAIAQYNVGVDPPIDPVRYVVVTRIILCVLIPFGYCSAGAGLLWATRRGFFPWDRAEFPEKEVVGGVSVVSISRERKIGFMIGLSVLGGLVAALTGVSYAYGF